MAYNDSVRTQGDDFKGAVHKPGINISIENRRFVIKLGFALFNTEHSVLKVDRH
jgi:hypothetical protein